MLLLANPSVQKKISGDLTSSETTNLDIRLSGFVVLGGIKLPPLDCLFFYGGGTPLCWLDRAGELPAYAPRSSVV